MDGGLQAWLTVLGGWIAGFCTFGAASSFGVYQALYTIEGTSSASNISWIGSVQLCLISQWIFGTLLLVFSLFMLSLADTTKYYQIILSQGIGFGLGAGLIYVPALTVQAHHWKKAGHWRWASSTQVRN
ncbi:hypothetical protein A0H81_03492 [Grifola frondosa]|uniref:Uncharacterized protein n=1 Tax=Grifola frondosa TaxID=5627 RepID=A0A1C7MI22_GRIFR|nr:hypothetical protein A0H81_03492 [Grifola frondosa]